MAAGLHGSARTAPRVRAELQTAQASTRVLAAQYGLNPKTVAKWRARRCDRAAARFRLALALPRHGHDGWSLQSKEASAAPTPVDGNAGGLGYLGDFAGCDDLLHLEAAFTCDELI